MLVSGLAEGSSRLAEESSVWDRVSFAGQGLDLALVLALDYSYLSVLV
jgi:hypothetical protein